VLITVAKKITTEKTAAAAQCTRTRVPQRGHSDCEKKSADVAIDFLEQAGHFLCIISPPDESLNGHQYLAR
jgi:hypothetical protein